MLALLCHAFCGLAPINQRFNMHVGGQTIMPSSDADERIRISVYDHDFGMWDDIYAAGLCLYVEWFLNLIHHVLRHLLCKQMVAMTSSDMSRSVFGFAWRRQSDMTHADFCVYILWCATSFAVYSFLGLLSWSACSLEFEFSNCIRPEPRARRPRFVS